MITDVDMTYISNMALRLEAAAVCRNSAIAIEDLLQLIRRKCLHCFHEPAEIPVELVLSLHELESASSNLHAASDEFSADPDIDTIKAMQHIREQAARDAAAREQAARDAAYQGAGSQRCSSQGAGCQRCALASDPGSRD